MSALKRFFQVAGVAAVAAAVARIVRDRLVPEPEPLDGGAPAFRVAPVVPAPPRAGSAAAADDLTEIHGVGPVYAGRLADQGIATFRDLADADAGALAGAIDASESQIEGWIAEAKQRAGG